MSEHPLIVLGAGATKACGGPPTDEILPAALRGETAHDDLYHAVPLMTRVAA